MDMFTRVVWIIAQFLFLVQILPCDFSSLDLKLMGKYMDKKILL